MVYLTSPFLDIHVHTREPGFTHKETIATAVAAAKAGGFGAFAAMPNTSPVIDTPELVRFVLAKSKNLGVTVYPVAAVTVGQLGERLTDFLALKSAGAAALSDDGLPINSEPLLKEAIIRANQIDLPILLHCEPETEQAELAVFLSEKTKCPVHICHVSLKSTVEVIRKAKRRGIPLTAETCPHYMTTLASGKMNPPLGTALDVEAILKALCDGVLDCISTDHAPHTEAEKASQNPPNGVIGLETALAVTLEALYHSKMLNIEQVFALMHEKPAEILRVPKPIGEITIDTDYEWNAEPDKFRSMARNTPFPNLKLRGKVM